MKWLPGAACAVAAASLLAVEPVEVVVDSTHPTHRVSKDLYGLFLEDISLSVDGCFYPELVWNRGFDFPATNTPGMKAFSSEIQGWREDHRPGTAGRVTLQYARPKFANTPAYLRLEAFDGGAGVRNDGPMHELSVEKGVPLALSLWARGETAFHVALAGAKGVHLAPRVRFAPRPNEWCRFTATLVPTASVRHAALQIRAAEPGTLDLEQVSLSPQKKFRDRPNGLRADIGQLMADLRPATFRFPGGCMLEGNSFASWYDWKRSIGPVEERMPLWNIWGYYQTLGLGYFEYLQFCEDIGAKPVPVFLSALTCQLRPPASYASFESLGYFATNILDGIEFARGGTETRWGRVRAAMGHPEPFALEYVGIGNENRWAEYYDRYDVLAKAVRERYPDIKLVAAVEHTAYLDPAARARSWARITKTNADVADEHMYGSPSWWLNNARMYDSYPRTGVDVYVGEWATRNASDAYINSMYNAVCEAAFRMGFERNADLVRMSAYAPLIRRTGFPGNRYSLIQLSGTASCGAPAYWCEKMFAENRPDRIVPVAYPVVKWTQPAGIDRPGWKGGGNPESQAIEVVSFHAVGGVKDDGTLILKFANAAFRPQPVAVSLGRDCLAQDIALTTLTAAPDARNTPENPQVVIPRADTVRFAGGRRLAFDLQPCSVTILRLKEKMK